MTILKTKRKSFKEQEWEGTYSGQEQLKPFDLWKLMQELGCHKGDRS